MDLEEAHEEASVAEVREVLDTDHITDRIIIITIGLCSGDLADLTDTVTDTAEVVLAAYLAFL